MDLDQAIREMVQGHKVKLPEWGGYWYLPEDKRNGPMPTAIMHWYDDIHVFTKQGDILTTAWVDKYKERDDFELTEGKMGFDFAILALKNGKRIAREGWNGKGMWLVMFSLSHICIKNNGEILKSVDFYSEHCPVGDNICMKTAQNTFELGWRPTSMDMLATDWIVVSPQLN